MPLCAHKTHFMLLRVVLWYVGSGRGSVVSSVAGQVLWLNVYRVTRGHNSCQFAPPLGTRRNRGNLFSLARLSSRDCVCVVSTHCSFRLSYLARLRLSFLHLNAPSFLFVSLSQHLFFFFCFIFMCPLSSPPSFLSSVTQG